MDSRDADDDADDRIQSFSDHELVITSNVYGYANVKGAEESPSRRSFKTKRNRSMSLSHFQPNEYSLGEVRRIHERLAARKKGPFTAGTSFRDYDRPQVLALICLCILDFISFCSMSILAPFFPKEAALKNMSQSTAGLVFGFYALVIFLFSPVMGRMIPLLGARFVLTVGLFIAGTCNLLFGILHYIDDPILFATFCFAVRGLEALGAAAYSTAGYVFVVEVFPSNIGSVLGLLEIFVGLGMSTGPAIGGLLYSIAGFGLPFYTLGVVLILTVPVTICLLPSVSGGNTKKKTGNSLFQLLRNPVVLVLAAVIIAISITWSALDPTLEPHLRQFALSPGQIGLIFLLFSGIYGVSSPLWGWLSDYFQEPWIMMSAGLFSLAVSFLLLGPSPLIGFLPSVPWLIILSLCFMGASVALGLLPTFQGILDAAIDGGCDDDLSTYSMVAGAWSSLYALGEVIGPIAGGAITEKYGFAVCCTVVSIICAGIGSVCTVCACILPKKIKKENSSSSGNDDEEYTEDRPLLSSSKDW